MIAIAPTTESNSREQDFLDWFSLDFQGKGLESKFQFGATAHYCVSFSEVFQGKEIAGHGYDADQSAATLKAAAELMERRSVVEYFLRNSGEPLHNSNGWAVHFSVAAATEAAKREAMERHLLLYTYLLSGWSEFVCVDRRKSKNGEALFLASPYTQDQYFSGIVIYRDNRFSGVSFGYLADHISKICSSPRWNHALFEAIGFVERGVETGGFSRATENSIYNGCREWLTASWDEPLWKTELQWKNLHSVSPRIQAGRASDLVPCYEGLHFSRVEPGKLIPLFLKEDLLDPARKKFIAGILDRYGLVLPHGRTPIL